jgi:hypothetical protein
MFKPGDIVTDLFRGLRGEPSNVEARRRWPWIVLVLALIGALTALCVRLWPHERLLLKEATKAPPEEPMTEWPDDWHQVPTIIFRDRLTGKKRRVRFSHYPLGTHQRVIYSNDHQWALGWDGGGPEPGEQVVAMELQTGRTLSWPNLGQSYHYNNYWMSDSRHWLQYTTMPDGYLTLYSVTNPKEAIRLPFPDYQKARWLEVGHSLTSQNHLLIYNQRDDRGTPWVSLDIRDYRLLPSVFLTCTWHARSPTGQEIEDVDISPNGDRIAMFCNETYVSPLLALLHRWLPRVPATPKPCLGLWVTRLDGSDAHEIGHVPGPAYDEATGQTILYLVHWLPGGKQIGFMYKDVAYTVPAE